MSRPPGDRPGRAWARRAAWLALVGAAGCMSDWQGSYLQSYQQSDSKSVDTTQTTELLQVETEDLLSPDVTYRVSDRLVRSDATFDAPAGSSRLGQFQHEPSGDLLLALGSLLWTQGLDYRTNRQDPDNGPTNTLVRQNLLEKLELTPEGLPRVASWLDYRTYEDDFFVDRSETRTNLEISDDRGAVSYLYSLERELIEDHRTDVSVDELNSLLRAGYVDEFLDSRLSTSLDLMLLNRRRTDRTPGGGTAILPVEILPLQGLHALDSTPSLGALPALPSLIDGDSATSTGINIGGPPSGGSTDHNMGVELPLNSTVDLVYLATDVDVGDFFASQYSFSAWTSEDNLTWALVAGSVSFTYERAFQRFRLVLPAVTSRYLKVVCTAVPPTAGAIFVTEMRVFTPSGIAGRPAVRQDSDDNTRQVSTSLSYRATDRLRLGYDLLLRDTQRDLEGTTTRDERQVDHRASAWWTATDEVDASFSVSRSRTNDRNAFDERRTGLNGLVAWRPLDTLDVAATLSDATYVREGSSDQRLTAYQVRSAAQLLDTLQAELSVERNRLQDDFNARIVRRDIVRSSLFASLTARFDATLMASKEFADVTGSGASLIPDPDETRYGVLLLYRPTELLRTYLDLEWVDNFVGDGLDQRFQVDWFPFPGGRVDIQLDAQRQVAGVVGTTQDTYTALVRWLMNAKAWLQFSYGVQIPEDADRVDILTLSLQVTF